MKTKQPKKPAKADTAPETVTLKYQTVIEATILVALPAGVTAEELLDALRAGTASYRHDDDRIEWGRGGEHLEIPVPLRNSEIIDEEVIDWERDD